MSEVEQGLRKPQAAMPPLPAPAIGVATVGQRLPLFGKRLHHQLSPTAPRHLFLPERNTIDEQTKHPLPIFALRTSSRDHTRRHILLPAEQTQDPHMGCQQDILDRDRCRQGQSLSPWRSPRKLGPARPGCPFLLPLGPAGNVRETTPL